MSTVGIVLLSLWAAPLVLGVLLGLVLCVIAGQERDSV
jgi:hypothetical protein